MTLKDTNLSQRFSFTLLDIENDLEKVKTYKGQMGRLRNNLSGNYTFFIMQDDNIKESLALKAPKNTCDLDYYLTPIGEPERFVQITEITGITNYNETPGNITIELTIAFFPKNKTHEMVPLNIRFDDRIIQTAERNMILNKAKRTKADVLAEYLIEHCMIHSGSGSYFLVYSGKDNDDYNDDSEEKEDLSLFAFAVYGDGVILPIEKRPGKDDDFYFAAKRIIFRNALNDEIGLRLVRGSLNFHDWTREGVKISPTQMAVIKEFSLKSDAYLNLWYEYIKVETNDLLTKARNVKALECGNRYERGEGTWEIYFTETVPKELDVPQTVEFVNEIPEYILNDKLNMDDIHALDKKKKEENKKETLSLGKIIKRDLNSLTVELLKDGLFRKYLILSIHGDKVTDRRRKDAKRAIQSGGSANPYLGSIIEDINNYTLPPMDRHIEPLTPYVREKIFKGREVWPNQEKAIDRALNTPDIAIIQGPPGTGKTTVITAIIERLNEIYGKTDDLSGRVYVGAFQHVAVENITKRLKINSLPAMKFGKRTENYDRVLDDWRNDFADKIEEAHPDISESNEQKDINTAFEIYRKSPSVTQAVYLLKKIHDLTQIQLNDGIGNQIESILSSLEEEQQEPDPELIGRIRSLRLSRAAFYDDGPEQAKNLLYTLDEIQGLNEDDEKLLKEAAMWNPEKGDITFLKELSGLKRNLLKHFLPKPQFRIDKPRADILELINTVNRELEKSKQFEDKKKSALAAFWSELKYNSTEINSALEDYSVVYAATVNFAGSEKMSLKKSTGISQKIVYDTVIIDEAARANPPDLSIPLSQGKRRIILVGDDRQLPQLVEEDIIEKAEKDKDADIVEKMNTAFKEESMFSLLKKQAKELEKIDPQRPRFIHLNAQFRMHPFLGDFISNHFYKEFGEEFESATDLKKIAHELPGTPNKPALWLDVPLSCGPEERDKVTKSLRRPFEAERIAQKTKEWIDSPEGANLSFGIISFYSYQTEALNKAFYDQKLCEENDDGLLVVSEQYKDRIEIGTVDAFQGREFDVVFLSLVRSRKLKGDETARSAFGFISPNRLCVSMSRQKKLLVLVGDLAYYIQDLARGSVPALYDFGKICEAGKEGGML